jgi:hypothetical protein
MRIFLASILNLKKKILFPCKLCIDNMILGKDYFAWTFIGELRLFRVVLRLSGTKKISR